MPPEFFYPAGADFWTPAATLLALTADDNSSAALEQVFDTWSLATRSARELAVRRGRHGDRGHRAARIGCAQCGHRRAPVRDASGLRRLFCYSHSWLKGLLITATSPRRRTLVSVSRPNFR